MAKSAPSGVERLVQAWEAEVPGLDAGPTRLTAPLLGLAAALVSRRERVLAGHGLDQPGLETLGALLAAGPPHSLTAGELTRRCRITPGATTQRVRTLETLGLVQRNRTEPDRRVVHVTLTAAGRLRASDALVAGLAADEGSLELLSARDRASLVRILGHWWQSVETAAAPSAPSTPFP
ncbi:MAG TPA: MarR family transcriptional regulator [Pedococcus sp.]|nr:MarR family transcriptional regulator [Pedococcus sp.]